MIYKTSIDNAALKLTFTYKYLWSYDVADLQSAADWLLQRTALHHSHSNWKFLQHRHNHLKEPDWS